MYWKRAVLAGEEAGSGTIMALAGTGIGGRERRSASAALSERL
jgi:hypothetical protein